MGEDQDEADGYEYTERALTLCHDARGNAHSVPEVWLTMQKAACCYRSQEHMADACGV